MSSETLGSRRQLRRRPRRRPKKLNKLEYRLRKRNRRGLRLREHLLRTTGGI